MVLRGFTWKARLKMREERAAVMSRVMRSSLATRVATRRRTSMLISKPPSRRMMMSPTVPRKGKICWACSGRTMPVRGPRRNPRRSRKGMSGSRASSESRATMAPRVSSRAV
jgi:hypothetical protein